MKLQFGRAADGVVVDNDSLRLVVSSLASGETERWPDTHGEGAVYVLDGQVELDGHLLRRGSAIVLHGDAPCAITAMEPARVARFSTTRPPRTRDRGRHLVGPAGWARSGKPGAAQATWYADSTCDGCDVTLLRVERDTPENRGRPHEHSADEILFMVEGSIRLGAHELPLDHGVFIPANTRYAVNCGPVKHAFLNYRAEASTQRYEGDVESMVETALGRDGELVGDVIA